MSAKNADEPQPPANEPSPPRRKSLISPEEVDALLEQSARSARDLREQLDRVFRLPPGNLRLR